MKNSDDINTLLCKLSKIMFYTNERKRLKQYKEKLETNPYDKDSSDVEFIDETINGFNKQIENLEKECMIAIEKV